MSIDDNMVFVALRARHRRTEASIVAVQAGIVLAALIFWQVGSGTLFSPTWFSNPVAIASRAASLALSGDLLPHVLITLTEMAIGFAMGVPVGTVAGMLYGSAPRTSRLANPIVIGIYSMPLVALSPLFILWFGLGIASKAALVSVAVFWLMFFTISAGMRQIDRDLLAAVAQLGGSRTDQWRLVVAPSMTQWFFVGLKLCIPYALVGAVVAEMIASSEGLGYMAIRAASFLRMDALYAIVIVLVVLGVLLNAAAEGIERHFARWRPSRQVQS